MEPIVLIEWEQIWKFIGPIVIGILSTLAASVILFIVIKTAPDEISAPVKRIAPYICIVVFAVAIYMASGMWAGV